MNSWVRLAAVLIEWAIQLRRRDEYEKRQERLEEARNNPGDYLRQFGRVRRDASGNSDKRVRGDPASTERDSRD
ncbi:hypothetical protein BIW16_07650 [Vibrio sp. OULL4]|nr:hypothetical protein BIW16_07650 [Vibrio sp. OULL4]